MMIDAGFVVKSSYTGDFLLHVQSCLKTGDYGFAQEATQKACQKIEAGLAEVVLQEADNAIDLLIEDTDIVQWAKKEHLVYAPVWEDKMAAAEECRQDFDDFLNWRFHQIEFFFEKSDVKRHVIRLAELSLGQKLLPMENIQCIPLVTSKGMYAVVYFGLLEQLVRPMAVSVMIQNGYELIETAVRQLSRLAVCILVDACHTVLRQELLDVYQIQQWDLNHAAELFDLPEALCCSLEECLLSME